jgi:hypothetical protein
MLKRMNQEHWKHQGRTTVQKHPETKYVLKTKQKTVFHFSNNKTKQSILVATF